MSKTYWFTIALNGMAVTVCGFSVVEKPFQFFVLCLLLNIFTYKLFTINQK